MDRARMKLGDKVTIPAVVEAIEYTTVSGEISYKVEPLTTRFNADEIEALQGGTEGNAESATTTDCISRQAAIEAFCDDCRGLKPGQCEHWDSCKSQKELRSLPPVTPKPVMTEEVREALMRLTMCAREECTICKYKNDCGFDKQVKMATENMHIILDAFDTTPTERTGWIPVSERLPKDLEEVVVTWVNRNPPVYYRHEKDKPQTGFAVLYRDTWHWWDSTIVDVLAEYGSRCEIEHISEDIEIIAWQPLPEIYRPEGENK